MWSPRNDKKRKENYWVCYEFPAAPQPELLSGSVAGSVAAPKISISELKARLPGASLEVSDWVTRLARRRPLRAGSLGIYL